VCVGERAAPSVSGGASNNVGAAEHVSFDAPITCVCTKNEIPLSTCYKKIIFSCCLSRPTPRHFNEEPTLSARAKHKEAKIEAALLHCLHILLILCRAERTKKYMVCVSQGRILAHFRTRYSPDPIAVQLI